MNEIPFATVKRKDLTPLCPHCGAELPEVYMKSQGVGYVESKDVIYFCPHCLKVLGMGQSRMI